MKLVARRCRSTLPCKVVQYCWRRDGRRCLSGQERACPGAIWPWPARARAARTEQKTSLRPGIPNMSVLLHKKTRIQRCLDCLSSSSGYGFTSKCMTLLRRKSGTRQGSLTLLIRSYLMFLPLHQVGDHETCAHAADGDIRRRHFLLFCSAPVLALIGASPAPVRWRRLQSSAWRGSRRYKSARHSRRASGAKCRRRVLRAVRPTQPRPKRSPPAKRFTPSSRLFLQAIATTDLHGSACVFECTARNPNQVGEF